MTTDKNNSIIKISSDELVQHKNKFKSIAIYNGEIYESEVVELINEANANFGTLVLEAEATGDKKGLILSPDWKNGNAPTGVTYTWKALAADGYTDLIENEDINISLDNEQNTLTILDQAQLTSAITVTAIAYKQNIFVAQSTPHTVFEKGQKGEDGPSIESEVKVYKWSKEVPETGGDGWKTIEDIEPYGTAVKVLFLWTCYRQEWTDDRAPTYTTPIRMTDYEMGTLMASKENLTIAQWCEKYGRTLIDGSTIATGSVTAKQINTEGLSAEYIQSNNYFDTFAPPIPSSTTGLTFIDKGNYYTVKWDGVTTIDTIVIPEKYNNILVKTIEVGGFFGCPAKTIYFPSTMDNVIEDQTFSGGALTTLYLPRTWYAYEGFSNPSEIECTTINFLSGTELKRDCFSLGEPVLQVLGLPKTLQKIDANTFSHLTALHTINFAGTEQEWNAIEGLENAGISSSVTINYLDLPLSGFKISSLENEKMINSKGFQVTQEGVIYSAAGKIAGWDIEESELSKETLKGKVGLYGRDDSDLRIYAGKKSEEKTEFVSFDSEDGQLDGLNYTYDNAILQLSYTFPIPSNIANLKIEEPFASCDHYFGDQQPYETLLEYDYTELNRKNNTATIYFKVEVWASSFSNFFGEFSYTYFEYPYMVFEDGSVQATKGIIAGWEISQDSLSKTTELGEVGLYSGEDSNLRIYAGKSTAIKHLNYVGTEDYRWEYDDNTEQIEIQFEINFEEYNIPINSTITEINIGTGGCSISLNSTLEGGYSWQAPLSIKDWQQEKNCCTVIFQGKGSDEIGGIPDGATWCYIGLDISYKDNTFKVQENGALIASNAEIKGAVYAEEGKIGCLQVSESQLNTDSGCIINNNGITIQGEASKITLNGLTLENIDNTSTSMTATGQLVIQGNGTGLILGTQNGTQLAQLRVYAKGSDSSGSVEFKMGFWIGNTQIQSPIDLTQEIRYWRYRNGDYKNDKGAFNLSIKKGDYESNSIIKSFSYGTGENKLHLNSWNFENSNYYYVFRDGGKQNTSRKWVNTDKTETIPGSNNFLTITGNMVPSGADYDLGQAEQRWDIVYANTFDNGQSDRRFKNSIESLSKNYETFFDKMEPTRYKYNNGTSNRYHTGFIAQQLVESLEESGLTTQDFAGVMLNHPGEENECWYLRRDEFVALNTWQIQKLKTRAKQAEETIELQDAYIKKLEERIEKLEQRLL